MDVTTPMGSSMGLSSVRAARSASSRNTAPENIEAGSSFLWFGPATMRAMCGITRPTKPIVPPTDTHTPMSTETATRMTSLTRLTSTPTYRALSSPMAKALSSLAQRRMIPPHTSSASARILACA